MPPPTATPPNPVDAICEMLGDRAAGEMTHTVLVLLSIVPKDVFSKAVERLNFMESASPALIAAGAPATHKAWDTLRQNREVFRALHKVRALLPDKPTIG